MRKTLATIFLRSIKNRLVAYLKNDLFKFSNKIQRILEAEFVFKCYKKNNERSSQIIPVLQILDISLFNCFFKSKILQI